MDIKIRKFVNDDAGIYYFKNTLTKKYYIGQAINIRRRLQKHIGNCNNNRYDTPLYRAIHKYGWEAFEFGILKVVDKDELFLKGILDFWERYYIILYNSYAPHGYNQTVGGDAGVLGYKMTDEQKQRVSSNSKKQANDGRNKVFCYDVKTKITIQCPSIKALSIYLNIALGTSSLRNLLVSKRYLIARTLTALQEKIDKYNEINILNNQIDALNNQPKSNARVRDACGKYCKKITEKAIQDIKDGMTYKEWIQKYNLSRESYFKNKQKLIKQGEVEYTRVYIKKVKKECFIEYMKTHTIKEASEYFKVNISTVYEYRRKYLNEH